MKNIWNLATTKPPQIFMVNYVRKLERTRVYLSLSNSYWFCFQIGQKRMFANISRRIQIQKREKNKTITDSLERFHFVNAQICHLYNKAQKTCIRITIDISLVCTLWAITMTQLWYNWYYCWGKIRCARIICVRINCAMAFCADNAVPLAHFILC